MVENPDIAKELLELILNIRIKQVVPQKQKTIELTAEGRGIRLDVYLDDEEGTVYDLEMQTTKKKDLPKRTRYYQGLIDLELLNRGASFSELNDSYIIFICTEDPYTEGRHIYSFENICKENTKRKLGDGTYKVFLNAAGTQNDVSENLMDFFRLVLTGKGESDLSKKIEDKVEEAKQHKEWRMEYVTLYMRDEEKRAEGRAEGRIEERILTLLEFNKTHEECVKDIELKFSLTKKEAEKYFEKFAPLAK